MNFTKPALLSVCDGKMGCVPISPYVDLSALLVPSVIAIFPVFQISPHNTIFQMVILREILF